MLEHEAHLRRAEDALAVANLALPKGLHRDAISRAYYAMYHAAKALLVSAGVDTRTHKGLIAKTRELFADQLGPDLVPALARLQAMRESSDYEVGVDMTSRAAGEACEAARRFVDRAREIIEAG